MLADVDELMEDINRGDGHTAVTSPPSLIEKLKRLYRNEAAAPEILVAEFSNHK